MRGCCGLLAMLLVLGAVPAAWAEEPTQPEQLKKMYDDALVQLKQAQDRRNELAVENEKLVARVGELDKSLASMRAQLEEMRSQASVWAERTYFLRSHYVAWRQFIQARPEWMARWELFLELPPFAAGAAADLLAVTSPPSPVKPPEAASTAPTTSTAPAVPATSPSPG